MCLEALLVADGFGLQMGSVREKGSDHEGWFFLLSVTTHMDSVTQNIQPVSSLLQPFWLSTSAIRVF